VILQPGQWKDSQSQPAPQGLTAVPSAVLPLTLHVLLTCCSVLDRPLSSLKNVPRSSSRCGTLSQPIHQRSAFASCAGCRSFVSRDMCLAGLPPHLSTAWVASRPHTAYGWYLCWTPLPAELLPVRRLPLLSPPQWHLHLVQQAFPRRAVHLLLSPVLHHQSGTL
jgi:hypothetical protein